VALAKLRRANPKGIPGMFLNRRQREHGGCEESTSSRLILDNSLETRSSAGSRSCQSATVETWTRTQFFRRRAMSECGFCAKATYACGISVWTRASSTAQQKACVFCKRGKCCFVS
jgi:hypothetical protein